ncbi:SGNH/GDSL hydrolase family protein [Actinosynnema sp. NPDC020468]|uniref:SGNH/GDSL hydrolase family protein n=1 Tax=Actinosynnema sp. NPDC020468 TaxID=3154488 RepID=UPI0033D9E5E7
MPIRLAVLGDSFVEGRGDPHPGGGYRGWVPRLAESLRLPRGTVRNTGTHGATTQDVVDSQLPGALVHKAPLIGVIVGVNDLVSDYDPVRFERNLTVLFGALGGADTTVVTATYPDIPANLPVPDAFRDLLRSRFTEANTTLRRVTAAAGALCLDIARAPEWRDRALWSADGLHPSPLGHRRFAESVLDLVDRATGLTAA